MKLHRRAAPIVSAIALHRRRPAVQAQTTAVALGMSGWTGFAPLTLADKAGIFKKHGVDVDIKMIPQKDRHLALASGAISARRPRWRPMWRGTPMACRSRRSCSSTSPMARMAWPCAATSRRLPTSRARPSASMRRAPRRTSAWPGCSSKNGMTLKDVKVTTLSPQAAAQAFVAGQNDGAMTYEPYLSTVRANPDKGKILATTLDYPMVTDTLGCAPKWLKDNPKAAQALVDSYFEALEMIRKEPEKSNEIMGAAVKQTGEQFAKSSAYLRWQDKEANRKFFAGELASFSKEAADVLKDIGVIRQVPDVTAIYDARFLK
jgi:NitT/TauT family transport system substrate-binding protein